MKVVTLMLVAIVVVINASSATAQFSKSKLDAIKVLLKPLEMKKADVEQALASGTLSTWDRGDGFQSFYRDDETIDVRYSTGKCEFDTSEFMPFDSWNVPKNTLVSYSIEPKDKFKPEELGIDITKLRRERLFRTHKTYLSLFDKKQGIAVYVWGDTIDKIHYFTSSSLSDRQCKSSRLSEYFRNSKWRFTRQPEHQEVDFNFPASVKSVNIHEEGEGRFAVVVVPSDPENDVVTFNYFVSAGKIVSKGGKATWDLGSISPGVYTLTVAVDDGAGLRGKFMTRAVTIK